jgi:hypothetical protein
VWRAAAAEGEEEEEEEEEEETLRAVEEREGREEVERRFVLWVRGPARVRHGESEKSQT